METNNSLDAYLMAKSKHPNAVIFIKQGDKYLLFENDAVAINDVCKVRIRKANLSETILFAYFPCKDLETYLPKMVRAGYRCAFCECNN